MLPLAFSPKGGLRYVERSWNDILSYLKARGRRITSKRVEEAYHRLSYLVRVLHVLPKYKTLEPIPCGCLIDLLFSLKRVRLTKKELLTKVDKPFYLPSILYGVANGYVIAVKDGNRLYVAGSPLTDLLVEKLESLKKDPIDLKGALSYLFAGLLIPSRASFMYMTMNSIQSTDPQEVERFMKMHVFLGDYRGYERLALATLYELRDTWYLGKFKSVKAKKEYVTPSHAAYTLAKTFNELIGFEDYLRLLRYVSEGKGLASIRAFEDLFSRVSYGEADVKRLLEEHAVISQVKDLIQLLKENYSELDREIGKLSSW
ncbi:MAG: hypothetical protein QXS32_01950 [Candidatus Nezhaarchaeales archaeon]